MKAFIKEVWTWHKAVVAPWLFLQIMVTLFVSILCLHPTSSFFEAYGSLCIMVSAWIQFFQARARGAEWFRMNHYFGYETKRHDLFSAKWDWHAFFCTCFGVLAMSRATWIASLVS